MATLGATKEEKEKNVTPLVYTVGWSIITLGFPLMMQYNFSEKIKYRNKNRWFSPHAK